MREPVPVEEAAMSAECGPELDAAGPEDAYPAQAGVPVLSAADHGAGAGILPVVEPSAEQHGGPHDDECGVQLAEEAEEGGARESRGEVATGRGRGSSAPDAADHVHAADHVRAAEGVAERLQADRRLEPAHGEADLSHPHSIVSDAHEP